MNKLGRNSLAVGLATLLVTSAVAFSAQAEDVPVAQSEARLINNTGLLSALDTEDCIAVTLDDTTSEGEGLCGTGLEFPPAGVITQTATAGVEGSDGVSSAEASTAGVDLPTLTTVQLANLPGALDNIDTGTVLDDAVAALGPLLDLVRPLLEDLLQTVDDTILQPVLGAIDTSLPIRADIGAVESFCEATPGNATGDSSVAGVDVVIELGDQEIVIPVEASTTPNSDLLASAPSQLVDDILAGVQASLTESLNGALAVLGEELIAPLRDAIVNQLLAQLEPVLLAPLSDALGDVLTGTFNKQVAGDGEIEVTALELGVLGDFTQIGQVSCGPNTTFSADDVVGDDGPGLDGPGTDVDVVDGPGDNVSGRDGGPGGAIADADAQADADVSVALPNAGAPNLLPFWLLGLGLVLFGAAVMINERRRALL